ncbi:hypothetical protein UT300003_32540 [Clostridium sardiniense]
MSNKTTDKRSDLKCWRHIAMLINEGNEDSKAVRFIDKKISESPRGENEEVIADEGQLLALLINMSFEDKEEE